MEQFTAGSVPGASAQISPGPPQPVSTSSSLPNASPNGGTPSRLDANQQSSENETCSPGKDGARVIRRSRLSVESLTCPSCGKVCSNKSKFMRHKSTHSEDRPYSCPLCKKGFKWVEYLSKHMKQQHPNSSLSASNITETGGNVVDDNIMEGENVTPISLLPTLGGDFGNRTATEGSLDHQQSSDVITEKALHSISTGTPAIVKDTTVDVTVIREQSSPQQECSGTFQNLYHSSITIVCSANDAMATNTSTDSLPSVTTIVSGSNPVAMTTSDESATFTTSSFESSHHNKVTFSVPVLSTAISSTSTTLITHQLHTKPSDSVIHPSFDVTFNTSSSFDHNSGFTDNALIVHDSTITCQLASSITNDSGSQSVNGSITEDHNAMNSSGSGSGPVKKYVCEHEGCTKSYRYKKDVIRHMKMKHGSQPTRYEQKEVAEVLLRKHGCSQCDKMYAHRKDLLRHERDVHSPDAIARREASKGNLKKYPCEQPNCNKFYVHKKDLIRHRRNDHNDFTDTKDMHIPEPVSPSRHSPNPAPKRQRNNWSGSKIVSPKAETVTEPVTASEVQWMGVAVVKEGNVTAASMTTSDSNHTGTLAASNCALFNTSPPSSNAASSLLSLFTAGTQQSLPGDTATAQLMNQSAPVHPLFSAVTSNIPQGTTPVSSS